MLTFELADDGNRIEVHGDRAGLLHLARVLTDLAAKTQQDHEHLMTPEWGGTELSGEKQGLENELVNHVKVFLWTVP